MARTFRETHTYAQRGTDEEGHEYHHDAVDQATNTVARVVVIVGGIIMVLLALRFVLMLLGANRGNGLVDFIYSASYPFAAPFFGIFNYQQRFGQSRFELETLLAIAVYAGLTWLIVRLVTIGNRHVEV